MKLEIHGIQPKLETNLQIQSKAMIITSVFVTRQASSPGIVLETREAYHG